MQYINTKPKLLILKNMHIKVLNDARLLYISVKSRLLILKNAHILEVMNMPEICMYGN